MMESRNITCVVCPKGCSITASINDGEITGISGSGCKRGDEYAAAECTNPVRTLTTIVRAEGGAHPMVPVKSSKPVPKHLLAACVMELNKITLTAPVHVGDVVLADIFGTGADIVATGNLGLFKI